MWEPIDIIFVVFEAVIISVLVYTYGYSKGENSLTARSDLIRPSLNDLIIEGKYELENISTADALKKLKEELPILSRRQIFLRDGNCITIFPRALSEYSTESKKGTKNYFESLESIRDGVPSKMMLFFKEQSDKTIVETSCIPTMYYKITQNVKLDYISNNVEDAQTECILFTKKIMHTFNSNVINSPSAQSHNNLEKATYFIHNTPRDNQLVDKIKELILNSKYEIFYVGWIDRTFLGDLENAIKRQVKIKIITKDPSGSSKLVKEDYKRMLNTFGNDVKMNKLVHDRFIVCV